MQQPQQQSAWWRDGVAGWACAGLSLVLVLVFAGLYVYALASANASLVDDVCPSLWVYMAARLACAAIATVALLVLGWYAPGILRVRAGDSLGTWQIVAWGLLFTYFACFTVVGGVIVARSMVGNCPCTTQLSALSFTNTPLLGDIGFVMLGCDLLTTILLLVVAFVAVRGEMSSSSPPAADGGGGGGDQT